MSPGPQNGWSQCDAGRGDGGSPVSCRSSPVPLWQVAWSSSHSSTGFPLGVVGPAVGAKTKPHVRIGGWHGCSRVGGRQHLVSKAPSQILKWHLTRSIIPPSEKCLNPPWVEDFPWGGSPHSHVPLCSIAPALSSHLWSLALILGWFWRPYT